MAEGEKIIATNRKAHFNYELLEKFEAGIVLQGTEVKSLREAKVNLTDAYAMEHHGEMYLFNCSIQGYSHAGPFNHAPLRMRKLLLHRKEIEKLTAKIQEKGLTLIPTRLYFKKGKAKLELALAKGKKVYDKRETIKRRETDREVSQAMKRNRKKEY